MLHAQLGRIARACSGIAFATSLLGCQVYDSGLLQGTGKAPVTDDCDGDCQCEQGAMLQDGECTPAPDATPVCDENRCDDGKSCTLDIMSEEVGTDGCPLCLHRDIRTPIDGDDCCPPATTAREDADCRPICGNRVVEPGERCDPCPGSCDDNDPCTVDAVIDGEDACDQRCAHEPVAESAQADRCCPKEADPDLDLDPDCARCGNGKLEAGELCDDRGRCTSSCQEQLSMSLIHRYRFDGEGERVTDSVGSAHGEVLNTRLYGRGDVALAGGSSNQYVALPGGLIRDLSSVTIEVWLEWHGGNPRQRIFDFGDNTNEPTSTRTGQGTTYFFVTPRNNAGRSAACLNLTARAGDSEDDRCVQGPAPLTTDGIHHIVASYGDDRLRFYLDGGLLGEREVEGALGDIDDDNDWIGRANYPEDELGGTVHEFRIYDRVLSADEVQTNFAAGPDP